jgi:hypothetical protein
MPDIWFTADFGQPIVLCHYAMRVWNRSHHGAWHLYGHSRGNLPAAPIAQSRRLIDHREPTPRIACPYSRSISINDLGTAFDTLSLVGVIDKTTLNRWSVMRSVCTTHMDE